MKTKLKFQPTLKKSSAGSICFLPALATEDKWPFYGGGSGAGVVTEDTLWDPPATMAGNNWSTITNSPPKQKVRLPRQAGSDINLNTMLFVTILLHYRSYT